MAEAAIASVEPSPGADVLALSPHLDDAVLSAGAYLARAAEGGERVVVATAYSSGPPPEAASASLRTFADFERRREEDAEALALIGARPRWLGLVERAFRPPALAHPLQTFETPPAEEPWPHLDELERATAALLDEHPRARILVPLAVGHHVDHVAVFVAACRALVDRGALERTVFYEDAYAVSRPARLDHFVAGTHPFPWWRAHELRSPWAAGFSAFLWMGRRGPAPEAWLPREVAWGRWRLEPRPLGRWAGVKERAIRRYASQLGALGGADRFCGLVARQARLLGGAEATWTVEPGGRSGERSRRWA